MSATIPDQAKAWLDAAEYATIATIEPDGRPQLSVVWVDATATTCSSRRSRDDASTPTWCATRERRSWSTRRRSPRATSRSAGSVTMTREGGRELIDRLARQYDGVERFTADDGTDRVSVVVRITPDKVVVRLLTWSIGSGPALGWAGDAAPP